MKKLMILSILLLLFLISCGKDNMLKVNNSQVKEDLMILSTAIEQDLSMGKWGSHNSKLKLEDINYELNINRPYGQTYVIGSVLAGGYQIMGFICNINLKKVVVLRGNYYPKKGLIYDSNGKPYFDGEIIGDCNF